MTLISSGNIALHTTITRRASIPMPNQKISMGRNTTYGTEYMMLISGSVSPYRYLLRPIRRPTGMPTTTEIAMPSATIDSVEPSGDQIEPEVIESTRAANAPAGELLKLGSTMPADAEICHTA